MVTQVTCREITGHTRDELTSLRDRAITQLAGPMCDDQRQAATLLLTAFGAFIEERVLVPADIRMAVAALVHCGEQIGLLT